MANPADRRRSTRVEVVGQIQGEVVSLDVPVRVREISLGGMSVETPRAFDVGAVSHFVLTLGDGASVEVAGKIVYSRAADTADTLGYVTGIQFVDQDDPAGDTPVGGLLRQVK